MLRERAEAVGALFYLLDLCLLAFTSVAAHALRAAWDPAFPPLADYLPLLGLLVAIWSILLYRFGLYEQPRGGHLSTDIAGLLKTSVLGFLFGGALIFGLKLYFVSRLLVGIFAVVSLVLLAAGRLAGRFLVGRTSAAERNVLLVGRNRRAEDVRRALTDERHWGVRTVDAPHAALAIFSPCDTAAALTTFLTSSVVDEVIFAIEPADLPHVEESLVVCERLGVKAHVSLSMERMQVAKTVTSDLRGIPMLTFTTTPFDERDLLVKRAFDVVMAIALLGLTAPLLALVAVLVKVTSSGPVLFKQIRAGANGRPFVMYKFRSMCENAEVLQGQLAGANEMSGPVFKMRNDPRLTPIGRFLRRTSFDELPQLWNVLRGEMSLVGPRPPVPSEVARYESWQRRRLSMKPGLTCLWQISGRSEIADFEQWMKMDLKYIDTWSLALDMRIIAKTVPAVLTGRGAA